jgi:hypothetical protein
MLEYWRKGGCFGLAIGCLLILAWNESHGQRLVPTSDPKYPKIKYADSLMSLNDRCAVARNKLNVKVRPVYVNGKPVGFC